MHSAVQRAVITTISYKPLSGLNFAGYSEQYGSIKHALFPFEVCKPLAITTTAIQSMTACYM